MSLFRFVRRAQPRLGGWGRTAKAIRTCVPRPDGQRQPGRGRTCSRDAASNWGWVSDYYTVLIRRESPGLPPRPLEASCGGGEEW